MTITTNGFYNFDGTTLLYAPNAVYNKNFELHKDSRNEYDYPIHNWYWFGNREEALEFFEITEEDLSPNEEEDIVE
jgi:hypothetical protein